MEKRVLGLVSFLFFMVVSTGCAVFGSVPASETRRFYNNTLEFGLQNDEAAAIMNNAAKHYVGVTFNGKNDAPNVEKAIYELYVRADKSKDHVVTEKEAKEFWENYRKQFDSHVGTGPINFQ